MCKVVTFLIISIFSFSCQKDKQVKIAGTWREISTYSKNNSGEFYWSGAPRFPLTLVLTEDGKYSAQNDVPAGQGIYQYSSSTRQIRFEAIPSGNTDTTAVSLLNEDYMILDYSINGAAEFRQKFVRMQY